MTTKPITLQIRRESDAPMDDSQIRKMRFVMNALHDGWTVKKRGESYIFTKKHEGKREIFMDNYLETFLSQQFS
jgi:hypothetical protein